jgi:hypothetical protein
MGASHADHELGRHGAYGDFRRVERGRGAGHGNAFFPIEEGMQLLVSYLTLWVALITIKLGLKTWSWFAGTNVSNGPF